MTRLVGDRASSPAKSPTKSPTKSPAMTVAELDRFLAAEFSQAFHPESGLKIEAI